MALPEKWRHAKFGVFVITKEAEGQYRIDITGAYPEPGMRYTVEFDARGFENTWMSEEKLWPPEEVEGHYRCEGGIGPGGHDGFRMFGPKWITMISRAGPYFNVYYVDETVEPPAEESLASGITDQYTWYAEPAWKGATIGAGIGTAIGYGATRDWKTVIGAGAGALVGWLIEKFGIRR